MFKKATVDTEDLAILNRAWSEFVMFKEGQQSVTEHPIKGDEDWDCRGVYCSGVYCCII